MVEAIVAEMERHGVAGAVADLGFDPMPMAQAVIRAADGVGVPFPGRAVRKRPACGARPSSARVRGALIRCPGCRCAGWRVFV